MSSIRWPCSAPADHGESRVEQPAGDQCPLGRLLALLRRAAGLRPPRLGRLPLRGGVGRAGLDVSGLGRSSDNCHAGAMTPTPVRRLPMLGRMRYPWPHAPQYAGCGQRDRGPGQQTLQRLLAASGEVLPSTVFMMPASRRSPRLRRSRAARFISISTTRMRFSPRLLEQVRADFASAMESASPVTGDVDGYWALHDFIGRYLAVCDRWAPMLPVFVEIETPDNRHATFGGRLLSAVIRSLDSELLGPCRPDLQRRAAALCR